MKAIKSEVGVQVELAKCPDERREISDDDGASTTCRDDDVNARKSPFN